MVHRRNYAVSIQGVGVVKQYACSKWEAIDRAYYKHCDVQPDRKKYTARATL